MEALQDEIALAVSENQWGNGLFVPNNVFNDLFTEEVINQIHDIDPEICIDSSAKTIATLLYNNRLGAHFLEPFHAEGFKDLYLPVEYNKTDKVFVSTRQRRYFGPFFSVADCLSFEYDQWLFCSPSFGNAEHQELDARCPLPIIYCSMHPSHSRGDVYKVKMHHAHLKVKPQPTEENNPFLAMKRIVLHTNWDHSRELRFLQRLQRLQHPHLIKIIGSFRSGNDHFFLFPWANGGVKPSNVVVFTDEPGENPRGILRITDAGLARFYSKVTSRWVKSSGPDESSIEYGPPPFKRDRSIDKVSHRYDMWSLGCLLLEFIVWVLGGVDEVNKFRTDKEKRCPSREFYQKTLFGYEVQSEVRHYIDLIFSDKRCQGDCFIRDILKIIKNHLLKVKEDKRIISTVLEYHLLTMWEKAKSSPGYLCGRDSEFGFYPGPIGRPNDSTAKEMNYLSSK